MASLAQIRQGLAANLAVLDGIQVSAYVLGNPTLPTVWVRPATAEGIEYHRAFANGLENWTFTVQAFFASGISDIGAQQKLDELLASTGATSVKAALETDKTLGGLVKDLIVQTCTGYLEYGRPDGTTALGCDWTVVVYP